MTDTQAYILPSRARALAHYPHARRVGNVLYVSGLSSRRSNDSYDGAEEMEDGTVELDVRVQTRACLDNLRAILDAAKLNLTHVVDVTCFLVSMEDYAGFNETYNQYFSAASGPTRTTVAVSQLPNPKLLIEIKAVAYIPEHLMAFTSSQSIPKLTLPISADEIEPPEALPAEPLPEDPDEEPREAYVPNEGQPARAAVAELDMAQTLDPARAVSPEAVHDERLKMLAQRLAEAEHSRAPCEALSTTNPALTLADAYRIQRKNITRRLRAGKGRVRVVGHKIGITSVAVQEWLDVSEPDFGHLLSDMAASDGDALALDGLLQPRVEGELAFVLSHPLRGPGLTASDIISATSHVLPAIEVVDSRVADWKITIVDTVADNASSARFVLGNRPIPLSEIDPQLIGMVLRKNGRVAASGAGAASMNSPVNAVVWLANTLGRHGQTLPAGSVILSGALGPVIEVAAGDHFEVQIGARDRVSVRFV